MSAGIRRAGRRTGLSLLVLMVVSAGCAPSASTPTGPSTTVAGDAGLADGSVVMEDGSVQAATYDHGYCDGSTYFGVSNVRTKWIPTDQWTDPIKAGDEYSQSHTDGRSTDASVSAEVSAEGSVLLAKVSATVGTTVGRSWSSSDSYTHTFRNSKKHRTRQDHLFHVGRQMTIRKFTFETDVHAQTGRNACSTEGRKIELWRRTETLPLVGAPHQYNRWVSLYRRPNSDKVIFTTPNLPGGAVSADTDLDFPSEGFDEPDVTPLYQYFNPTVGDHFYTTTRADAGLALLGWTYEGCQGQVYVTQEDGTVPLRRWWNPDIGDHYYGVEDNGFAYFGYTEEPYSTGYVYSYNPPEPDAVPLHRYWNGTNGDHSYVVNRNDPGMAYYGYAYEGIAAYVLPSPVGGC